MKSTVKFRQSKFASLPYSVQLPEEISGEDAAYYKPKKPIYNGDEGPVEVKTLGWLRPEEHPEGLLCRPCPECGCTDWIRFDSGGFVCNGCGRLIFTDEMTLKGEDDDEVGNGN